jgi:hypothetical protein
VQSLLGLQPDAANARLLLRPTLPRAVNMLRVSNLCVGEHRVSFEVRREHGEIKVDVTRAAPIAVVVEPPLPTASLHAP